MRRIDSWKAKKKTGAVKQKIKLEHRNFINSIHEDVFKPSPSDGNFRHGLADKDEVSISKKRALANYKIPAEEVNATTYTGQEEASYIDQQGSVQNFDENDFNENLIPDSSSDEEYHPSDLLTKNIELREKLKHWSLTHNIKQCALKDLLLILNETFDSMISLPMDPRTIMQTPQEVHIKPVAGGEYWHHGIKEQLTKILNSWTSLPSIIHLMFNFDGLPIFKSAKKEFWPILAKVVEGDDLFVIGIYYGTGKPKNLEEYLRDFVAETKTLLDNGIRINNKNVCVKIRGFVCDSPARAFIKGIL